MKNVICVVIAAAFAAGCSGGLRNAARELGNDITLPSLYGNFQEERAARTARSLEGSNPCFADRRAGNRVGLTPLNMRAGVFLEWCQAALDAEMRAANAYSDSLTRNTAITPTGEQQARPPGMPSDWTAASEFAVQRYLDAGIALSNQLCEGYFQRMGLSDAALSFGDTLVSDVGTAASGIQAITGVAPRAIGATSAVLGLAGSTLRNGRENFVFDGNIDSVYFLVRAHRRNYVEDVRSMPNPPKTFWRAYDWLNSYHTSCSYMSIRVMVDEALTQRATRATSAGGTPAPVTLTEAQRQALSQALGIVPVITDEEIVAVFAMTLTPPATVASFAGFPTTEYTRGEETISFLTLFRDAAARRTVTDALITAGGGALGAYMRRAQSAISARSFTAAAPSEPTPAEQPAREPATESPTPLSPTPQGSVPVE